MAAFFASATTLTHSGTMALLAAAIAKAEAMGVPQCIVVVDASGEVLGSVRMTGAKFLSVKSATAKARTAASIRAPSGAVNEAVRLAIAAATDGSVTGLPGGYPVRLDGAVIGGIGVGSGTGEQDSLVALAALAAIGADTDY